ncbi:hypothetical protein JL722_11822 [Aureococcus anophagefferens]|nr:hypothetical protein JL722_11822 [Aureococcus anophagefferens]
MTITLPETRSIAEHAGWGIANAVLGAVFTALGETLRLYARRTADDEARGSEPGAGGARCCGLLGRACVAVGVCSGVVGDALLPICTQAPFTRWRRRRAGRRRGADEPGALGGVVACAVAATSEKWRLVAVALTLAGPPLALVGAPLDDVGGLSVVDARILVFGPPAVAYTALSAVVLLVMRRVARRGNASVLLAYATLGAALGSAWVHVVVKAIVEVLVFYSDDAPMAPLAYATVWAAFASLPVLACLRRRARVLQARFNVFLQRAFVLKGRRHFPERVFGPLVAALSVATNAVCGAFYFDDLGLLGSHITPVLSPDVPMEAPPPASNSDVAFYFAGVGLAVAGTLLTLPFEPAGDEKAEAAAGADADEFGDGSPYDPEYDQHVFGDAYGALTKAPLGDDPLLGPGRKPKEQKRDWNCSARDGLGTRRRPAAAQRGRPRPRRP